MKNYNERAARFCEATKAGVYAEFSHHGLMPWDEETGHTRDVYRVRIEREGRKPYTTLFGQSVVKSQYPSEEAYRRVVGRRAANKAPYAPHTKREAPTAYDVLATLVTYDPGSYADFCAEFGYAGGETSLKVWASVREEYAAVQSLFGDVLDELRELL